MTVSLTFEIADASSDDRARIRLAFERLGWIYNGGNDWIYPTEHGSADFFNYVLPGLWHFREMVVHKGLQLRYYHLNLHVTSSFQGEEHISGYSILPADEIAMSSPRGSKSSAAKLSESKLRRIIGAEVTLAPNNSV